MRRAQLVRKHRETELESPKEGDTGSGGKEEVGGREGGRERERRV